MTLIFNEKAHTYHLEDLAGHRRQLDSNTDMLEALGFLNYDMVPEPHRSIALQLGTDVAKATALLDTGRSWKAFRHLEGWVEAWKKAKKDFRFRPEFIEQPFYDPYYLIATCPDRHGLSKYGDTTIQIKTGEVEDFVSLQTAFEERCIFIHKTGQPAVKSTPNRFAIQLNGDGTYYPRRFEDPNDIRVYLGAISVYQWLKKHNKLRRKTR